MGIMDRFKRPKVYALPKSLSQIDQETHDMAELNMDRAIETAMRKSLSYANYVAFDNVDDQGGFFGTEFELRSTAGRIKGLYSREPWIFTSSQRVAMTLASVPLKVYALGDGKELPKHPLQAILNSGSKSQSSMKLKICEGLDLMLGGNFFIILEENMKEIAGIAPVDLVNLVYSPDYTRIDFIEVYSGEGGKGKARFPMDQCIHVSLPNPYNYLYGMSPFAAAARPILLDRYKNEFEMAFYLRGATSAGVIETTEDLSKSRFKRLLLTFEQVFTGRSNWWRTLFLPKGATWKQSSLTMNEMQHLEGLRENRKTILATLGIPPSIVGLVEDVNRATAEQQERIYWHNTIIPLAMLIADGWNNSFLVKEVFKGKVEIRPDFGGIEAVEGFASWKAEKAKGMESYYLIDEIREKVWGDDPVPDGMGQRFTAEIKGVNQGMPIALSVGATPLALPAAKKINLPEGYECQALWFSKNNYKIDECGTWARANGYKGEPVDDISDRWQIAQKSMDGFYKQSLHSIELGAGVSAYIGEPINEEREKEVFSGRKAAATGSQNRIESKLSDDMKRAFDFYLDDILADAKRAIIDKRHVREYLISKQDLRMAGFMAKASKVYDAAMERGFSAANAQVKFMAPASEKRARFTSLSETDRQAVDVLRERTRDGRRKVLADRAIERFVGMDATRTDLVMGIIEEGERQGLGYEQIAANIRSRYNEAYENQSRTIVRTEILSAVSEGLNWNHEVLREVFTEVLKEWLHQGDEDINPDARLGHAEVDGQQISGQETWKVVDSRTGEAAELRYPRDPLAPPGQVINCRCTMVSVIPEGATSNADRILDRE